MSAQQGRRRPISSRATMRRWWPRRCGRCWPTWWATATMPSWSRRSAGARATSSSVGAIVDACLTPPFLLDRRVVVVREAGRLLTADVAAAGRDHQQDPLPTTVLVLVGGGGTVPAPVVKAVNAAGEIIDVTTSKAGERKAWLHDHLRGAPVKLEPAAADLLARSRRRGPGPRRGPSRRAERRLRRGRPGLRRGPGALSRRGRQRAPLRADRRHRPG